MTIKEYFGEWLKVFNLKELYKVINVLNSMDKDMLCPEYSNIFKAFTLCPYEKCTIVFIGQDPYPQKGVAQGILFGNSIDTPEGKLSPSLNIVKECAINLEIPHNIINFDNSLESWAKQGILMLNSALTCEVNKVGAHTMLWRKFMSSFLNNLSNYNYGLIYVLFGERAKTFKPYINASCNDIMEVKHPAYYARTGTKMPYTVFTDINNLLYNKYGTKIKWYQEIN